MMTVPMDNSLISSSRERAELRYKKNNELEGVLQKLAKSRVASDPNIWYKIRENYEAIILEDHEFSDNHGVELAVWQLHYRRIEEFRTRINAAKTAGAVATQGGKPPGRPDSIMKILSDFKTFLSESSGFYHDLIQKIRSKFGLPLGFLSDGPESQSTLTKDENGSIVMKKGLMSCHRCLIYLGDLARYKGSYGEGDSVSREYAAASSYYKHAVSLCPSNGNPHHQLALLAFYSSDEVVAIYRYFRSLAADTPFSTARDNLIVAFEKNRQSCSLLPSNPKAVPTKTAVRTAGKGRGRGDARLSAKGTKPETSPHELSIPEVLKAFCTRFVRLNGIIFTRTSLETFGEIFSAVKSDLLRLLSTGSKEVLNFGRDAAENGHFIVRLIAILTFTVHNVKRVSERQSYAEILQQTVLLQNAYAAAFEFTGLFIERCIQLHNAESSFLLPAISVFIEWLASHPDIVAGSDSEEKQAGSMFFWNQYVTFMNKLISSGVVSGDGDNDASCFFDMSQYDERETGNRLPLWEDFELRGYIPFMPAQLILDFSRKHSFGGDESEKERQARVQRIFAAGRALMNVVRVDNQVIYFDPHLKKFVIGVEPPRFDDYMPAGLLDGHKLDVAKQPGPAETKQPSPAMINFNGEDEEEEIVFKPSVMEKYQNVSASVSTAYETTQPTQIHSKGEWGNYGTSISAPFGNFQMPTVLHATSPLHNASANFNSSKWMIEQAGMLSNGLKNVGMNGDVVTNHEFHEGFKSLQSAAYPSLVFSGQITGSEACIPSIFGSNQPLGMTFDGLSMKSSAAFPSSLRKNPVGRPIRHLGPPPGFNNLSKPVDSSSLELLTNGQNLQVDDYSWLDGYQSSSTKATASTNSINIPTDNTKLNGIASFPFPGKQISTVQTPQVCFQQTVVSEQHQAESLWSGQYFV